MDPTERPAVADPDGDRSEPDRATEGETDLPAPAPPDPADDPEPAGDDIEPAGDDAEPAAVAPPVVAVVVTRDPGPWLEECLTGLAAQDYPALTVLVLDDGSADDPTARIAAVMPGAFVRRLPEPLGFARAADEAVASVQGATFLLVCHDDAVLDPPAVRLLVEEAYRSNAAVVGPKVVEHDRPEVLLEVGWTVDRFGHPSTGIEPGELDQEQHDAVRDVFSVSTTAMLVRADLFAELGGFDAETAPGAEDLDLCWRARIAGARVMVAPDARVRHYAREAVPETRGARATDELNRVRVRAMLTSTSTRSLLWVAPLGFLLAVLEALGALVTGQRARARGLVRSWTANLRDLGGVRTARRRAQRLRAVPDAELRYLQHRGSTRARHFVRHQLGTEERLRVLQARGRTLAGTAGTRAREPVGFAVVVFLVVVVIGSRSLWFDRVPEVGSMRAWPGLGELLDTFGGAWRHVQLGSPSPQPPLLALAASLGTVLLGATALARTLLVVGALPLGFIGAWRLGRAVAGRGPAAVLTGLAYGVVPLPRNAIANGRLGPLVVYALAPFLVAGIGRAVGLMGPPRSGPRWRPLVGAAALLAVMTAFWPLALALPVLVALAWLLAAPLAGAVDATVRFLALGAAASAAAIVLLVPWPIAYLAGGARLAALGFQMRSGPDLSHVLRFETGPAGAGAAGWVLLAAGLLVLVLASGPRLAWAIRAWALALVGFALVWLPARFAPDAWVPAPEGLLVPAALGLALAVGLGGAAFLEDVRGLHFGWRQVASLAGAVALALPALALVADAGDGRWHLPSSDWGQSLAWMRAEADQGGFRVLWLGDPSALPLDSGHRGTVAYALTANGPGDLGDLLPPPERGASRLAGDAVDLLRERATNRIGRVLGMMGVRYVAVPERSGPGFERTAPAPAGLRSALDDQLDLMRLESDPGIALYENSAWVPTQAVIAPALAPEGGASPLREAAGRSTHGAVAPARDDTRVRPGRLVLAEAFDGSWHAEADGRALTHTRAYGWANGWNLTRASRVSTSFDGQWPRRLGLLVEIVVVLTAVALYRGRIGLRRRRVPRGAHTPSEPLGTGPLVRVGDAAPSPDVPGDAP